jgi:hypothetical protein
MRQGLGIAPDGHPAAAADFLARAGVRGRGFNESHLGGYLAFRFWPDRERLPFIGTQPEYATAAERRLTIAAYTDPAAWAELDALHRFDWMLLSRDQGWGNRMLDYVAADGSWTMVFADDVAELLVRSDGRARGVAERFGYRVVPPGEQGRRQMIGAAAADSALRRRAIAELLRMAASSERNGSAHHVLGILAMMENRLADARGHLERALALKPGLPRVHELLGRIALLTNDRAEARRRFDREIALHGSSPELEKLREEAAR